MWRLARRMSSARRSEVPRVVFSESDFKEGTEVEGFLVNKVSVIPEFNMTMVRLRHVKTGCNYLHLARDDANNVFGVGFRTTPMNSTGVPHILEHTTLCGSSKFPCRDPFFKMLNRSMATFMNAFTGPDYTFYPFSTQNRVDYGNLMAVYLDAVFRPNLKDKDFYQEGWRLEHEVVTDKNSPIIFKGVVYNEMKGVFSDNNAVFSEALVNNILPSHTYGVVSGGDPAVIPKLTYLELKNFHKKYYHPSNCRIYSYGNFPLVETLGYVNKAYLGEYDDSSDVAKSTKVPLEPKWETERRKHIACRHDPMASSPRRQSSIAISTLCNDVRSPQETFVMQVIAELLVKGPNSAFYKSMIESNLGTGFHPVTGFESQLRDCIFSVGLSGVDTNDFDRIVEVYHQTLDQVIDEGFEDSRIKGILHTIELTTKHQSSEFGLGMLFSLAPVWNHDGDVEKTVKVNDKVMKLKKGMADNPMLLQDMVQELKDSNHRLILSSSPDPDYEAREAEEESNLLKQKLGELTMSQRDSIYCQGIELKKYQEEPQDPSCLPTLSVSDLAKDVDRTPLKGFLVGSVPTQLCVCPTNGLTYFRGVVNTAILSDEAKALLPLFCTIVTRMGTEKLDYRQLDQMMQLKTGGMSMSPHIAENIYDSNSYEEGVTFSSFCLDRNVKAMMQLWTDIFTQVSLTDQKRFETLVKTTASNVIQGISDSGHLYAISTASSLISSVGQRKEISGGLSFVSTMKELSTKTNLVDTLEMMSGIADAVLKKKFIRLAVNTGLDNEDKVLPHLSSFLDPLGGGFKKPFDLTCPDKPAVTTKGVHHELPYQVSHTAMSLQTVEYTHKDFPVLRTLCRLLTHKYLLPTVREKGGAYGAGCNVSTSGVLSFYSYRDPNPCSTFDAFNAAQKWIMEGRFKQEDVDEAKLGVFQSIDAPTAPGSRGIRNFLYGITDDELQRHRLAIMALRKDDIVAAATKYLSSNHVGRALLGPSNISIASTRSSENWEKRLAE